MEFGRTLSVATQNRGRVHVGFDTYSLALSSGRSRYQCSSLMILFSSSSSCFFVSASRPLCMNCGNTSFHQGQLFTKNGSWFTRRIKHRFGLYGRKVQCRRLSQVSAFKNDRKPRTLGFLHEVLSGEAVVKS